MKPYKTLKLKKETAGEYKASKVIDGVEYEVRASLMDDYNSFSYTFTRLSDSHSFSDGWYGMRLKDIKNTCWSDVVQTLNDN